ncbi:MAG: protein-tyrosine phosphatase [Candidatus Omnitrophota bacterium]|jgi:protein-tyrosine phosphatase
MAIVKADSKQVLFICTANYYRSRFAEAMFNYYALKRKLKWTAVSRGLATYLVNEDLSRCTAHALHERGIDLSHTSQTASQLTEVDLESSDIIIALHEKEHRPLMDHLFPFWVDKVRYWDVPDMDKISPEEALPMVEALTLHLLDSVAHYDN